MTLPRIEGPITLEGRSTKSAWQDVDPLPMRMYQPEYGGEVQEPTEARVAFDDEYLYVSG